MDLVSQIYKYISTERTFECLYIPSGETWQQLMWRLTSPFLLLLTAIKQEDVGVSKGQLTLMQWFSYVEGDWITILIF